MIEVTTWQAVIITVIVKLRVRAGPRSPFSNAWPQTAAPKATTTNATRPTASRTASIAGRHHDRTTPNPAYWVTATAPMAASHHHGVAGERWAADDHTWAHRTVTATVPTTTAPTRRGVASRPASRSRPPATRTCTHARASTTTA